MNTLFRTFGLAIVSLGLATFVGVRSAEATAQRADILIYEGQNLPLFSNPLESYYQNGATRPHFESPNTANWRGYIATWEIDNGVLYLRDIEAWIDGSKVGMNKVFPGQVGRIEAKWFTGKLRVPQGERLQYVHMGYGSIYEKDLIITIEAGKVVKVEVINHSQRTKEQQ